MFPSPCHVRCSGREGDGLTRNKRERDKDRARAEGLRDVSNCVQPEHQEQNKHCVWQSSPSLIRASSSADLPVHKLETSLSPSASARSLSRSRFVTGLGVAFAPGAADVGRATETFGARAFLAPSVEGTAGAIALVASEAAVAVGTPESPVSEVAGLVVKPVGPSISPLLRSIPSGEPFLRPSTPCSFGKSSRLMGFTV